ncbi:hypothetical protein [Flammeovirga kamogawensis]|uniref:Uncharacterized protein n=1 Tax=Flammeovirga kamogawensis TaxID=373891 RepID=A0ABX8H1N1_9BACT|nr:hypothetical protein [Flammeovirga kamogawensis]MBB6463582.1 hypothetical protein [Flammeovirga kamogawensis]QWG09808.1 hypothetical protein KM029_19195 [Flammeovirga kamogawensis]TRX65316.1 hypothetical protein EO216_22600 [Flammeovirga kamogawensis]
MFYNNQSNPESFQDNDYGFIVDENETEKEEILQSLETFFDNPFHSESASMYREDMNEMVDEIEFRYF